jgi:octaprenyl-diphosphate synthase
VIDDVLDYDGDVAEMGKNLGDDLREGKVTLPLIVAMQRGTPAQRALIEQAIETGGGEMADIVAIVEQTGALATTRQRAAEEAQRAIDALASLPDNEYRQALHSLAAQLLERRA